MCGNEWIRDACVCDCVCVCVCVCVDWTGDVEGMLGVQVNGG